jgi:fucose permease
LGSGATVTAANNLVSDIGEEKRGALLSFANIFFGLGGLITPFLAANLLHRNSIALAYVIAALAVSLLVLHATTAMPAAAPQNFEISQALRLPGKRLLVLLSLLLLLYVACEVAVWNWLAKYLVSRGLSRSLALNILAFGFATGMMVGRLIGMRLLSRYSAVSVSLVCSFLMAAATFWMLNAATPVSACLSVLSTGIVMGPLYPSAMAMTGDAFTQMGATRMGIVITAGWIGAATSSWWIGTIAGGSDTRLRVALLLLPLFAVLMITVSLALRPLLAGIQSRKPIVYDARARPTI